MALLAAIGCGGPGQQSSTNLDMEILEAEGEILIQGTVFNDLDGDGILDMGEPGIYGAMVDLEDSDLAVIETTATDPAGYYYFTILEAGTYTVVETDPSGFISTTPNEVTVEVVDDDITVNFGDWTEVTAYPIYGFVYDDLDGDGIMGTGEPGIPGVMVELEGAGSVVTGSDGSYAFAVTAAGIYTVTETDPEGYISTTPNEVVIEVIDMGVQVDFGDMLMVDLPVDIKPGSDINPLNLRSKGVLPVVILGSEEFDAAMIDPASLLLNGVAPLRWSYEDVCGPDDMAMDGEEEEMPDGYDDLVLKFSTQEIAATLGAVERGDILTLTMTGSLMDGTSVQGEETVWIVQVPK